MEKQKPRRDKIIMNNKRTSRGITVPDFKLYCTVIKTARYWHKNRHVDQWNQIKYSDINLHTDRHLIFYKEVRNVQWEKESIFDDLCWSNWMSICSWMQIDPDLSPCTKLKSKWTKDFNIKSDTVKMIEEKAANCLEHNGTGDNRTLIVKTLRATINKWDLMKL